MRADGAVRNIYARAERSDSTPGGRVLRGIQQDITELAVTRERLGLAQQIARIGDWEWDIASGDILWSDTVYDIYGLDRTSFKPRADNVFQYVHEDDRERMQGFAEALIETGKPCEAEFRVVRPDGESRVISCRGMREIASDGRIIIRSVQQDVTALAQARDRLREAETQYRFLFKHNPLPMWVFDRETLAFLAVNDAMLENYGYSREELLAGTMLDIRPPEDIAAVEAAARLDSAERPQGRAWTHLRKDGSRLRAAIYTQDIQFNGSPARLVLAQDVTEQERTEQRFQLVARATSDAVYDLDIETGQLWWSDSFYSVFGFDRETVPATLQAWEDLLHPDDLARVNASLAAAIEDAGVSEWEEEYRFRRGDGSYADVTDRGFLLRDDGRATRMVGGMLDITEKHRYESDLRLLRRAVEATQSGILIADARQPDFPAVYVNPGFEAMSGYSAAELIGKDSRALGFDQRDLDTVRAIRRAAHEHAELRVLLRNTRKDGTLFWNDFYMAPVRDEQGVVTHMVSVSTDVTARQQSEERFHLVVRATSDAIWDSNPETGVTWRSENVNSLFGYSPGEIGDSLDDWIALVHPGDRERVVTSIQAAHDTGAAEWEAEYRFRRKDGTYADVFDRGFLQRDESGRVIRAVGGMLDVTQKHRDETDLRLLRRAVESTENGVVIADARQPDLPVVYVNAAFERITGYSADEVLGRNCRFLQGDDRDQIGRHEIHRGIAQGHEARALLRNYRKDGEVFWNDLHINPVRDEAGVVTHFVGVQNDVTERQRYQEQIAHRATHDELTGLPNRTLLLDRLQQAIASAARFSRGVGVAFVDLDNFKLINDNLGHGAGDLALRAVAVRLAGCVRDAD
ncbi:MAG: PAS domain S-box protein, partial [Gammaproteobacteria bacterium]|nr:PAS domain S-box protein [Gammaproteobacteria bacterium]